MSEPQLRKAIAKGFYQVPGGGFRVVEPGEQVYVPANFKAKWLEPSGYEGPKRGRKPAQKPEGEA